MDININEITGDVISYFDDYGVEAPEDFNLQTIADEIEYADPILLGIMFCNLEDTDVMTQIANGDYSNFDSTNPRIFNDGYRDLMEQMHGI